MLHKNSLAYLSTFCNRNMSRLLLVPAVLGLTVFCEADLKAQATVHYLQQVPIPGKVPSYPIPAGGTLKPGTYGKFNLPGYGATVYVGLEPTVPGASVPELTWAHSQEAEFKSTLNGLYNWGADTDLLNLYNATSSTETYTLTFYFDGFPDAPNPADLVLVVSGLEGGSGSETTVTVSGINGSGPTTLGNTNGGEYTFPADPTWWCYPTCKSTSPTVFPTAGNLTFSSGYVGDSTDQRNTGWDIYQPNSPGLRALTLTVTQVSGDGIGFTLGYNICTTLVGISVGDGVFTHLPTLYNINTTTGAATNPRPPAAEAVPAGIAFSPMSPGGTLYELTTLYPLPTFTADPTSGTLYFLDRKLGDLYDVSITGGSGALLTLSAGGVLQSLNPTVLEKYTRVFTVPTTLPQPWLAAMAFDSHGNLYIVDSNNSALIHLTVNGTTVTYVRSFSIPNLPTTYTYTQGLAIDPWSGVAYYADGGTNTLYTLDLTTGTMTEIGPLTGVYPYYDYEDGLGGLTFVESPPGGAACPVNVKAQ